MTKAPIFHIVANLKPIIGKQDTKYRKIVLIEIYVCCAMYKLAQGANFLVCNELFAMGKYIVSFILHEFVYAINQVYVGLMKWPEEPTMTLVMEDFFKWCGLPSVIGVVDGAHISIPRPQRVHAVDYYHKTSRYSIVAQAVVDCNKRFIYVYVGFFGSVNGFRVLCKFGVHRKGTTYGFVWHC